MEKIRFVFEGKHYEVGQDVCDKDLPIKLPDGRLLKAVNGWTETFPSSPNGGFELVPCAAAIEVEKE